jgi:hypothetical protein
MESRETQQNGYKAGGRNESGFNRGALGITEQIQRVRQLAATALGAAVGR